MSFWRKLCCCCIKDNEISVDENTRLLPKSDGSNATVKKVESPFTVYAFGVIPPGLHMKIIQDDFSKLGVIKIACGIAHVLMLTETNFVIAAGNNEFGQCARNPEEALVPNEDEPELQDESSKNLRMTAFNIDKFKITDIAAGCYHSVVLVKAELNYNNTALAKPMVFGHPMGCGFNNNISKHEPTEVIIDGLRENISSVYAGQMRSMAVTESGKIYYWGESFTGTKQVKPRELPLPQTQTIKKVSIGKMFSMALTGHGKVYTIGDNTYGELGLGRETKNSFTLIEMNTFPGHALDIASGARHGLVLNNDNRLFAFGDNSEGQCGIQSARAYLPIEIQVKNVMSKAKPEMIYCGDAHSALVNSDGELFTWGDNTAGRLGIRGSMSVFQPRIVEDVMGKHIVAVGCGGLFTSVLIGPESFTIVKKRGTVERLIPPK